MLISNKTLKIIDAAPAWVSQEQAVATSIPDAEGRQQKFVSWNCKHLHWFPPEDELEERFIPIFVGYVRDRKNSAVRTLPVYDYMRMWITRTIKRCSNCGLIRVMESHRKPVPRRWGDANRR